MSHENKGEIEIESADDANVPVNSLLCEPDEDCARWRWIADNYMPRKNCCGEGGYEVEADTREELLELVKKHVAPLYAAALHNLTTRGENYYWSRKD